MTWHRFHSLLFAPVGIGLALLAPVACSSDTTQPVGDGDSASGSSQFIDTDGDGLVDAVDTDGDGVADVFGTPIDLDGDGVVDGLDTDGDGIIDIEVPAPVATGDGDVGVVTTPTTACSGQCVDLLTDSSNCGSCGNACSAGTTCKSGSCEGCAAGQTDCTGLCVNTQTDRSNCGACGNLCNLGANCVAGVCESCEAGQTECNGACIDTSANPQNCGSCGNACGTDQVCSGGTCIDNTCGSPDELPCGEAGLCVNVKYSNDHCGTCGQACTGQLQCLPPASGEGVSRCRCGSATAQACDGQCVETNSDVNNCGSCGNACPASQYCEQGVCRCGGEQVLCNGSCQNADQCSGGGVGAQAGPRDFGINDRGIQRVAPAGSQAGDGSVECGMPTNPVDPGTGGGTSGGTGGGSSMPPVVTNPDAGAHCGGAEWTEGKATWYELVTPLVHCSYPTGTLPQYYGAINDAQYAVADLCGACVEVEANGKTLEIEIVDECPYVGNETWCYAGSNHIDLNPAAFQFFEPAVVGVFDMRWRVVPCSDPGDLEFTFKAGSSIYWTGLMIRNHPIPITSVEVAGPDGTFRALERQEYNYWLLEAGFGAGPYTLRVTDSSGAVLERPGIPELPSVELAGDETTGWGSQISSCQ